jgi:hypothetical protein
MFENPESRRRMLLGAGSLLLASCSSAAFRSGNTPTTGAMGPSTRAPEDASDNDEDPDEGGITYAISPSEDLMREHGVLSRVLLIYEESARRLEAGLEFPRDPLVSAIDITRRFVQEYH